MKRVVVSIALTLFFISTPVFAAEPDWAAGTSRATIEQLGDIPEPGASQLPGCTNQTISISRVANWVSACVVDGANYSIAYPTPRSPLNSYQYTTSFHIRIGSDQQYYPISNLSYYDILIVPEQSHGIVVLKHEGYNFGRFYRKYDNALNHLSRQALPLPYGGYMTGYVLDNNNPNHTFSRSSGEPYMVLTTGLSSNHRFLFGGVDSFGTVLIDMNTNTIRKVASYYNWQYSGGEIFYAVSDTGKYALSTSPRGSTRVFKISEACGITDIGQSLPYTLCPEVDLTNDIVRFINSESIYTTYTTQPKFIDDYTIEVITSHLGAVRRLKLEAGGYVPPERLEYLALGDSYSSGEGDIPGSYYRKYTKAPNDSNDCHISGRSYPFLLRDRYNLPPYLMQSVACSGASIVSDYTSRPESYRGQDRRLDHLSQVIRTQYQFRAIGDYTPGYVPQLEFVKKYKPKVVTVTGGGNDVGFAPILRYCAGKDIYNVVLGETCGYAQPGSELERMLSNSIDSQKGYLSRMIRKIREYSPNTKIILIGYPSFINDQQCMGIDAGFIGQREQKMINRAINQLNSVISKAAQENGTHYADVEHSLYGGRLCEPGSKYMTGAIRSLFVKGTVDEQSIFHPNSDGHKRMAQDIIASGTFTSPPPVISQDASTTTANEAAYQALITESMRAVTGSKIPIALPGGYLQSRSNSKVKIYSQPTQIGSLVTDTDGSVEGDVQIPNSIEPGYHVLTLTGLTSSGEPVTYYQFITVAASPSDLDGDGIADQDDKCNFISVLRDEHGHNLCDTTTSSNTNDENSTSDITNLFVSPNDTERHVTSSLDHDPRHLTRSQNLALRSDISQDGSGAPAYKQTITTPFAPISNTVTKQTSKKEPVTTNNHYFSAILIAIILLITILGITYAYKKHKTHLKS